MSSIEHKRRVLAHQKKIEGRQKKLKELDAIGFDELRDHLAETVHTSLRKGCDGGGSHEAWKAIRDMDPEQWSAAVEWMVWALRYTTNREQAQEKKK
jgi:hypothetical protein